MYTIDNIAFENYGLYVSTHKGQADLQKPKQQLFTAFAKEGYQITKREANDLTLNGFIIANSIADFITKTANLRALFSAVGLREIVLDNETLNCFAMDGFKVENVKVMGSVIAKFQIKLKIV